MKIEMCSINSIKPYPNNPRDNRKAIDKVAESISRYGFRQPIVVDANGVIIVGHSRFEAAKKLGMLEVPVHVADNLTEAQTKAYRLADNRVAEESEWNINSLREELESLRNKKVDLAITGFKSSQLAEILAFDPSKEIDDSDHVPDDFLEPPVAQCGDIWMLGKHRVMCGDSTKQQDVATLIGENKINLVFTDPPYNVEYTGGMGGDREMMANDGMPKEMYFYFLKSMLDNCAAVLQPNGSIYLCHSSSEQVIIYQAMEAAGFQERNQIIWAKHHFVLTNSRYKPQHEPIFYGHLKGQSDNWYGGNGESSLWKINKPMVNSLHPTMKPVALVQRAIHNSSKVGDLVFDAFGGLGTTLIACEYTERTAFIMEITPRYVDTIIRRWQSQTKQQAYLLGTKLAFDAAAKSPRIHE